MPRDEPLPDARAPGGAARHDHVRFREAGERDADRRRRPRRRVPPRLVGPRGPRPRGAGVVAPADQPEGPRARRRPREGAREPRRLPPLPRRLAARRDPGVDAGEAPGHRARHGRRRQPLPARLLPLALGPLRAAHGRGGDRLRDGGPDRLSDAGGALRPPREDLARRRGPGRPSRGRRARPVRPRHVAGEGRLRRRSAEGVAGRGSHPRRRRFRLLPLRGIRRHEGGRHGLLPRGEEGRPVVVRRPGRPPLPLPRGRRDPAGDDDARRRAGRLLPRAPPGGRPPRPRAGRRPRRLLLHLEPPAPLRRGLALGLGRPHAAPHGRVGPQHGRELEQPEAVGSEEEALRRPARELDRRR